MKLKHTEPNSIKLDGNFHWWSHIHTGEYCTTQTEICEVFAPTKEILLERIQTIISAFEIAGRSVK